MSSVFSDKRASVPSSQQLLVSRPDRRSWVRQHKGRVITAIVVLLIAVVLAIILPVVFLVVRRPHASVAKADGTNPFSPSGATSGGDGSTIITENGTSFTYQNPFGGIWVQDPDDPFNDNAQPNSWTPPLNTSWNWTTDRIYGVNLGGLFVLEPFISPSLFQRYPNTTDEFTLSVAMRADSANGGIGQIEDHYRTFITEPDIAEIAGAGLNWLRIPIPFWAIETWEGEPYLERTSWTYFLKVLDWARKYGLRVCLDLHTIPGSQNGYNHSGRLSPVNFLAGNMGLANAERALYYIRVLTEFVSQPAYRNLIPIFGIVNEPLVGEIGVDAITSFYLRAHDMIRNITGFGEGNGPYIAIHDGFLPLQTWYNFLQGSDRIILDQHPYFAFGAVSLDPVAVPGPDGILGGNWPKEACDGWGPSTNDSRKNFGVIITGEFSDAPNDCGLFLHGVGPNSTDPQCDLYNDWQNYNDSMKAGLMNIALASFDAFQDWFFWTWKIGESQTGEIGTPLWSYQLGLRNGWMPKDPRAAEGMCLSLGTAQDPFNGTFLPWQTGTPSSIPASSSQSFPWPPPSITLAQVPISLMPTYTDTAAIITLPPETFTSAPVQVTASVDGWFDKEDTEGGVITVAGCPYPDEYNGIFSTTPTAACTGPSST